MSYSFQTSPYSSLCGAHATWAFNDTCTSLSIRNNDSKLLYNFNEFFFHFGKNQGSSALPFVGDSRMSARV